MNKSLVDSQIQKAFKKMDSHIYDDINSFEEKLQAILNRDECAFTSQEKQAITECCKETLYFTRILIEAYINTTLTDITSSLKLKL